MYLERKVTLSLAGLIAVIGFCMVPGFSWSFGGGVGVGVGGGRGGGVGIGHGGGAGVDVGRGGSEGGGGSGGSAGARTAGSVVSGGDTGGGGDGPRVEASGNASAAGNSAASGGSGDAGDGSSSGAAINSNPGNGGTQTGVNSGGSHAQADFMRERAMLEMGMGPRRPDRGIEDALSWDKAHKRWSFWDLRRHGAERRTVAVDAQSSRPFSSTVQTSPAMPSITADPAGKANANLAKTDPPGTDAAEKLIERKHATRNLKLVETDLPVADPVKLDRAVSNPAQPDQPRADRLGAAPARDAAVSTTPPPIMSPAGPVSSARVAPKFRKIDNHDVKRSRAGVALDPGADPQIHKNVIQSGELKTEIVLDSHQ